MREGKRERTGRGNALRYVGRLMSTANAKAGYRPMNARSIKGLSTSLRNYCPRVEQLIFVLALIGLLDVVHLWVQASRDFAGGCTGLRSMEAGGGGSAFDCAAVTSGPGSELFGISNLTWGLLFYSAIIAITIVVMWAAPQVRRWVRAGRAMMLSSGVGYSAYLTYVQVAVIEPFCMLCFFSAVIVTSLMTVELLALSGTIGTPRAVTDSVWEHQASLLARLTVVAGLIGAADVVFFKGGGLGSKATANEQQLECKLSDKAPVSKNGTALLNNGDIIEGPGLDEETPVTVIEYFDPNCPHCKDFHEEMNPVAENRPANTRIVYKPFALRRESIPEIQALHIAADSSKFGPMLEGLYRNQGKGEIRASEIREVAETVGLNGPAVLRDISAGTYQEKIIENRQQAMKEGVKSTPTVLVNGHFVQSRSGGCLEKIIAQAREGRLTK